MSNSKWTNEYKAIKKYNDSFGIVLNEEKMFETFTAVEWYNFVMDGKINKMPDYISKRVENWIEIFRYVVLVKHSLKRREEILRVDRKFLVENKLTTIRIKIGTKMYDILNVCFPEHSIKPWELGMVGSNFYKEDENKILAIEWLLNKNNLTIDDIINSEESLIEMITRDGLVGLYHSHFNGIHDMFEWFFKQKGIPFSIHDWNMKPVGYWSDIENLKVQIGRYIDFLFNNKLIADARNDIPYYFSHLAMQETGYYGIIVANYKYNYSDNLLELIDGLYPKFNIDTSRGRITGADGTTRLGSLEEKKVFDYIYLELNIKEIDAIGFKKRSDFFSEEFKEYYCPDFIIEAVLDKPIIIEYFGWYVPSIKDKHVMFANYINKTHRKNDYFRKRKDIYYVDLYPTDLKNNMINIKYKISEVLTPRGGENK